jgi:excisionase family DNA binding protein
MLLIPSASDIQAIIKAELAQLLAELRPTVAAPSADEMLSVEEVAEYTHFHRRTVEKWALAGEFNEQGKRVYLQAYKYSGRLRFKRADVEAFGLGIGVLEPSIAGEAPQATKVAPAAKKSIKKIAPQASEQALKVA